MLLGTTILFPAKVWDSFKVFYDFLNVGAWLTNPYNFLIVGFLCLSNLTFDMPLTTPEWERNWLPFIHGHKLHIIAC